MQKRPLKVLKRYFALHFVQLGEVNIMSNDVMFYALRLYVLFSLIILLYLLDVLN
jgi:hypothetical protein